MCPPQCCRARQRACAENLSSSTCRASPRASVKRSTRCARWHAEARGLLCTARRAAACCWPVRRHASCAQLCRPQLLACLHHGLCLPEFMRAAWHDLGMLLPCATVLMFTPRRSSHPSLPASICWRGPISRRTRRWSRPSGLRHCSGKQSRQQQRRRRRGGSRRQRTDIATAAALLE